MKHFIFISSLVLLPMLSFSQTTFIATATARSGNTFTQGTASVVVPGSTLSPSQRSNTIQRAQSNAVEAAQRATGKPARVVPFTTTVKKAENEKKKQPKYSTK